ncbi:hypothetical protein T261_8432 [Streptomyces lydicus]|nr:hypothetical protein T261_8432 [Streptomyces lydicus]
MSSQTISELLPCVDTPSEGNSDAALERMAQEHIRFSEHIDELAVLQGLRVWHASWVRVGSGWHRRKRIGVRIALKEPETSHR